MKLITLLLGSFLILSLPSKAQFIVNMGGGLSLGRSPVAEVGIGYNWKLVNVTGAIQCHTTSKVTSGVLFELKLGHDIPLGNDWGLNPQFGYSYHYASEQLKYLNTGQTLLGIELYKMFREDIGIYGAYTNTGKLKIISAGVRGYF